MREENSYNICGNLRINEVNRHTTKYAAIAQTDIFWSIPQGPCQEALLHLSRRGICYMQAELPKPREDFMFALLPGFLQGE